MKRTYTFATLTLIFSMGFLYMLRESFLRHTCFCDYMENPQATSELVWAAFCGLAAVASAIGVEPTRILGQFMDIKFLRREKDEASPREKEK